MVIKYAWHYTPPTGAEFSRLLKRWRLSYQRAGNIVDVTGRTIARFADDKDDTNLCPFAVLYVLAAEGSDITITKGGWRKELRITK